MFLCVLWVLLIVKKCIRMCGKFVVLNIGFRFRESVEIGFFISLFGFMMLIFFGCIVIVLLNRLLKLKLMCFIIIKVIKLVLNSNSMVLIICIQVVVSMLLNRMYIIISMLISIIVM